MRYNCPARGTPTRSPFRNKFHITKIICTTFDGFFIWFAFSRMVISRLQCVEAISGYILVCREHSFLGIGLHDGDKYWFSRLRGEGFRKEYIICISPTLDLSPVLVVDFCVTYLFDRCVLKQLAAAAQSRVGGRRHPSSTASTLSFEQLSTRSPFMTWVL